MTCSKCGKQLPDGANFCTECGNYCMPCVVIDAMHTIFTSNKIIVVAMLFTIAVIAKFLYNAEIMLLEIPIAVAMWMVAVVGHKGENLSSYKTPLTIFSTVALIDTVIMWLIAGVFMIMGVLLMIFGSECIDEMLMVLSHFHGFELVHFLADPLSPNYSSESYSLAFGTALLLYGAFQAGITHFIYTKIHHCAASALKSFRHGENHFRYLTLTKITIFVLALLSIVIFIQNVATFRTVDLGEICAAAGEITVFALIGDLEKKIKIRQA